MYSEDDIHYAFETTRVLYEPDRRIDTFGSTEFKFRLVTELMDSVNQVRVRSGRISAEKPTILRPESLSDFQFEGFGEQADAFSEWLEQNSGKFAFLKYGFNFKRSDVSENIVHDSIDIVSDRVLTEVRDSGDPSTVVIAGIDEAWEICLLRFTLQMIDRSQEINQFDFKRRGLI
ncbi:MAG: hypothetical protein ACI8UO_002450 [Verrucomicrobiales bacterium]|jgi:hypothetical protein